MLSVSGRMSTKTGTPRRSTTALAVEGKVYDGHDHLVARLEVDQNGGEFQRRGARVGQQRCAAADFRFEPALAAIGESAVARQLAERDGLPDILEFAACNDRTVERDLQ